jgi:hypothetical protein
MKNSIKVGPIKKSAKVVEQPITAIIKERLNSLKVGTFFEISGFSSKHEITNTRGVVSYYAKKRNIKFSTSVNDGVLTIERIKPATTPKTKAVPAV